MPAWSVSDDYPAFFLPRMMKAAARDLGVKFEVVDTNGLLPLKAAPQVFSTAFSFRRFLQKNLPLHLDQVPVETLLQACHCPS